MDIFLESDGSYSVDKPCDKKVKFVMAVDKSGARYTKEMVRNSFGGKREKYIRL